MKKIIGGRVYDTDTSKALGKWQNMDDVCNFQHYREALYRKRTGEYFLHGVGGPASKYAVSAGQNCWSGGEKIIPLTAEAAREWAEEHLDADEYAVIFGLPDEDDGPETLCIRLPAQLAGKIRANAADRGMSLSAYLAQVLTDATR